MDIAVGSGKLYKIQAAMAACERLLGEHTRIHGVSVESGVSSQPMTTLESIRGARNRAIAALKGAPMPCEIGIGIENGLVELEDQWFATTWVVARGDSGREGMASTLLRPVPADVMTLVKQGQELSAAIRELYGEEPGGRDGLIGLITQGALNRHDVLRDGIVAALSPLVNQRLFYSKGTQPAAPG